MEEQIENKILIVITDQNEENRLGGVYNFYMDLEPLLEKNYMYHSLNNDRMLFKNKIFTSLVHFVRMAITFSKTDYACLVLNCSLNFNAVLRDSVFVIIAKICNTKVLVFWHGWDFNHEKFLRFPYSPLTRFLLKSNCAIVLYSWITNSLRNLGYTNPVHQLTTLVRKSAFRYKKADSNQEDTFNLIFFSRVEAYKGIYELIEAYEILKKKYPNFILTIVGDGSESTRVASLVKAKNLKDVLIPGYVVGDEKFNLLSKASAFILPSYTEGFPVAVIEAMAVGLPVIVTPVGGINDFFIDKLMGSLIAIKDVDSIVEKVEQLYLNSAKRDAISEYNLNYAKENFMDEMVFSKLKKIIITSTTY